MKQLKRLAVPALIGVFTAGIAACDDDGGNGGTTPDPELQAPTAPTSVQASVDGTGITVTWSPGQNADSHRAELSTTDEQTRTRTVGGSAAEASFSGLTQGKTYSAQVFAVNSEGEAASGTAVASIPAEEPSTIFVTDDVLEDTTWESDRTYVLRGPIFVGNDCGPTGSASGCNRVTLTIEPGTTVLGGEAPQGTRASYLAVNRGSRVIADANADRSDKSARPDPEDVIVFTSAESRGARARGDWGGLIINGLARLNTGEEASGEGDTGFYGGTDDNDSSGIYRGVRVEFAGDQITTTDELNGIALQGVGAGTIFDYVQVHYNKDDGTEPFGGAVSQTHVVTTGIGDDSFDGTDGYRGFIQFAIAQQRADDADQGFEFSTGGDDDNATLVGAGLQKGAGEISGFGAESDHAILLREGANWRIFNTVATGFGASGFCVEGDQAAANADARLGGSGDPTETLRTESTVIWDNGEIGDADANWCDKGYTPAENEAFFTNGPYNNMVADPMLPAEAFSVGTQDSPPNVIATGVPDGYTAFDPATLNGAEGLVMPSGDDTRTLQTTDYPGAVEPGTALADAWYTGWTVWAIDGSDSRPGLDEVD